jgi:hypothetical protein
MIIGAALRRGWHKEGEAVVLLDDPEDRRLVELEERIRLREGARSEDVRVRWDARSIERRGAPPSSPPPP